MNRSLSYFAATTMAAAAMGLAMAGPAAVAHADATGYVTLLRDKYPFLSGPQLVSEGHRICSSVDGGQRNTDTIEMVVKDLGVSEAQAIETITAAMTQLGC